MMEVGGGGARSLAWPGGIRTKVIVDEAYSAVARQVGIPICDGLEPFREGA
jgi:hypothetical protein